MLENRATLEVSDTLSRRAVDGLSELRSGMGSDPASLSEAAWRDLLSPGLRMDDRDMELSAAESVLASGYLDLERDAALHRVLIAFRAQAGRHSRDIDRFVEVRIRVTERLNTLGAASGGAFSVAPATVLSDAQLYGRLGELLRRQSIRVNRTEGLVALVDSILTEIPTAVAGH